MIAMLLYSHIKKDLAIIKEHSFEVVCRISDDDWDFFDYDNKLKIFEFLKKNPIINISCIDVTSDGGIEIAEEIRRQNRDMYMILLSDSSVSPITYIKPTIMAGSLLLRPVSEKNIKEVFFEAVKEYMKKIHSEESNNSCFVIDNRDGKQLIPFSRIIFFESRSKKIFVNTEDKEYSFYDTLDNLENELNEDFIRCHRSFIISRSSIKKILFSQNLIELLNGTFVPLSRTYKTVFKELR